MRLRTKLLTLALALVASGCGTLFEPTAAVVDGTKIPVEEVDAAGERFASTDRFKQLAGEGSGDEVRRQFEQSYLSQQISHFIITAEAEEAGVEATEDEVQEQIDTIKENFETDEAFTTALADQGIEEADLPGLVRDQILETKLREEVVGDVTASPEEVRALYDENIADYQKTRVSHILIDQKDRPLAERLAGQLQAAAPEARPGLFARLARRHSTDPTTRSDGGDLGLAPSSKYVPTFAAAIDDLGINEVSDPINTQFGLHIIFVTKRVTTPFASVQGEIQEQIEGPRADEAWANWLREAYEEAEIRVNPRYGELDVESRRVVDTTAQDVPGSGIEGSPSAPPPEGQPEATPAS